MTNGEVIEKYGKCEHCPHGLHMFNYVLGENRACIGCGKQVKEAELFPPPPHEARY